MAKKAKASRKRSGRSLNDKRLSHRGKDAAVVKMGVQGLFQFGPGIPGAWSMPGIEPFARGLLVVDTGATHCAVDENLVRQHELERLGTRDGYSAAGLVTTGIYELELHVFLGPKVFRKVFKVNSITDIADGPESLRPKYDPELSTTSSPIVAEDGSIETIGIVGRDFLSHCHFEYIGPLGEFRFNLPPELLE